MYRVGYSASGLLARFMEDQIFLIRISNYNNVLNKNLTNELLLLLLKIRPDKFIQHQIL
jgi:hypothetical protein